MRHSASGPRAGCDLPGTGSRPDAGADGCFVGDQPAAWGSCTPSTGVIRLSHRLQPLPVWVVDYVLLQWLAHLLEPTHSDRFWSLVSRYPAAEKAKGYLRDIAGQGREALRSDVD